MVKKEFYGDVIPEKGEEFLIFAKQREPVVYFTASGPQGRYVLKDGIVPSMGEYEDIISVEGIDAKELKKELMQTLLD